MRISTLDLFDETISGTGTTWYSPAETWEPLGRGDVIDFCAAIYNVTAGTGVPGLTVAVEHSADGQNWTTARSFPEIPNVTISSNTVLNSFVQQANPVLLTFVRMRLQLSGNTPQCRVKVAATIRNY